MESRFLLVSLYITAILREATLSKRKEKLKQMTSGLGLADAYTNTLKRIQEQSENQSKLAMQALLWISRSERPVRVDELCHALAVEIGSTHLDLDNVPSIRTVSSCCLGLIAVDKVACTVRLIHFTLQEYLREHPTLFSSPQGTIAEVCLTYLNLQPTIDPWAPPPEDMMKPPLLEYASYYWGIHARIETTNTGKRLAAKLLNQYDKHISARLLLLKIYSEEGWIPGSYLSANFTGLHVVAFFGNTEILTSLLKTKDLDLNRTDSEGRTPLIWATMRGNREVVEVLLSLKGVKVRKADNDGRIPLSWAAGNGHQEIVLALLNKDPATLRIVDSYSRTPLLWAAESGKEDIVNHLLKKGANVDRVDARSQTALTCAAANGHEGVVKILLQQKKVNPDIADHECRTPLSLAAGGGFESVVTLLLGVKEVNPNTTDMRYGRTSLSWAAGNGYGIVAKLLLAHKDINPGLADKRGWTPLSWAAEHGHEEVMKVLLEQMDANPRARGVDGQTPISWAAF